MTVPGTPWAIVIPVKPPAQGKSRLRGVDAADAALAAALALDTITAAAEVGRVFVVTADAELAATARDAGADVVAENAPHGLDAAVAAGVAAAERALPGCHRAALLGDLPALRPDDLAAALRAAASHPRAVVPDAEGTGSTLVTARAGVPWASAFGADSFARHRRLGCVPLPVADASTLRRDVDTPAQLAAAARLGLGPHTAAALHPEPVPTP